MFSPDSRRFAYCIWSAGGELCAVLDGKAGPTGYRVTYPVFSPDSQRFAYIGEKFRRYTVFVDQEPFKTYEMVGAVRAALTPVFSPDSTRLAWVGGREHQQFVVCDGREGAGYHTEELGQPTFSPDSRHLSYVATEVWEMDRRHVRKAFMVLDGVEGPRHDAVIPLRIRDPEVKGFRYAVNDDGRQYLVEVDWPDALDWSHGLEPAE
jgi:hypothetical protein